MKLINEEITYFPQLKRVFAINLLLFLLGMISTSQDLDLRSVLKLPGSGFNNFQRYNSDFDELVLAVHNPDISEVSMLYSFKDYVAIIEATADNSNVKVYEYNPTDGIKLPNLQDEHNSLQDLRIFGNLLESRDIVVEQINRVFKYDNLPLSEALANYVFKNPEYVYDPQRDAFTNISVVEKIDPETGEYYLESVYLEVMDSVRFVHSAQSVYYFTDPESERGLTLLPEIVRKNLPPLLNN